MGWGEPTGEPSERKLTFGITDTITISESSGDCIALDCRVKGGGLIRIDGVWPEVDDLPVTFCPKHFAAMMRALVTVEAERRGLLEPAE